MTAQWKKFNGSEEQISEILSVKHGVRLKNKDGSEQEFNVTDETYIDIEEGCEIYEAGSENKCIFIFDISEYMILEPHPHADMIIEWASTGREVYWEVDKGTWCLDHNPQWLHGLKYSFNPDGDGK